MCTQFRTYVTLCMVTHYIYALLFMCLGNWTKSQEIGTNKLTFIAKYCVTDLNNMLELINKKVGHCLIVLNGQVFVFVHVVVKRKLRATV